MATCDNPGSSTSTGTNKTPSKTNVIEALTGGTHKLTPGELDIAGDSRFSKIVLGDPQYLTVNLSHDLTPTSSRIIIERDNNGTIPVTILEGALTEGTIAYVYHRSHASGTFTGILQLVGANTTVELNIDEVAIIQKVNATEWEPVLSVPQAGLGTSGTPIFTSVQLSGLTKSRLVSTGSVQPVLESVADLTSWIAGTTNQITVADDGDGTATLSLSQNIHTGASPTFTGLTLSGLTEGQVVFPGSGGVLSGDADLFWNNSAKRLGIGTSSPGYKLEIEAAEGSDVFMSIHQLGAGQSRWSVGLKGFDNNLYFRSGDPASETDHAYFTDTGVLYLDGLTATRLMATDGTQHTASVADLTSWIAGTTNQITVSDDGDGTATLSLPQNIHTGASPTFTGFTISGLTEGQVVVPGSGGVLSGSANLFWDGSQLGIGTDSPAARSGFSGSWLTVAGASTGISLNETDAVNPNTAFMSLNGGSLRFGKMDDDGTNITDYMALTLSNGSFGVGSISPNSQFQSSVNVSSYPTTGVYGQIEATGAGAFTTERLSLGFNTTTNKGFIQALINASAFHDLLLNPSGGNIGVGTTSPNAKLHVEGSAIFNENGADVDFRIEGDTEQNLFFVDASTDRIGVGTASPSNLIHLVDAPSPVIRLEGSDVEGGGSNVDFYLDTTKQAQIRQTGSDLFIDTTVAGHSITFRSDNFVTSLELSGAAGAVKADLRGSLFISEKAAALADAAGQGQLWVKDDTPNNIYFTDDAGNDRQLVYAGGAFHDGFSDFVANEHIDHSSVTLSAGAGIASAGLGDLTANRTIAVDGVLEDLDTLGASASDGQFIVATGVGAFAYESGATLRTSIGVGTGDSPTFTGLTLSGLTEGQIVFPASGGVLSGSANLFWDGSQLGIGTASPGAKLHIDQSDASGAIPVLTMDQADVSEPLFEILSTEGANNTVDESITEGSKTFAGYVKIKVNGSSDRFIKTYSTTP